jgi:threonine/homoserine/homoserine lactone efflux protein
MIDVVALATYAFVMSITPGPNNVMLTASGANFGLRRSVPHVLGVAVGFAFQTMLVCAGLGTLFLRVPGLQTALAWIGAAYLLYIAWKLIGAVAAGKAEAARPLAAWEAALFQFVNPKAWVMAITIAALFMPPQMNPWLASLGIFAVLVVVCIPCATTWAAFGSAMQRFLQSPRRRIAFNVVMAALLVGTAGMMLLG